MDPDLSLDERVKQAANDAEITTDFGRAEFIGTEKQDGTDREQRDDARRIYQEGIERSPVQGAADLWQRVRDRWGEAAVKGYPEFNPDQAARRNSRVTIRGARTTLRMRANAQCKVDANYGDTTKTVDVMRATVVGDMIKKAREAAATSSSAIAAVSPRSRIALLEARTDIAT